MAAANAARTEPSNQRHPLVEQLARVWPTSEWGEVTIVVAVSGGADSVALLRGLVELAPGRDGRIVAAHFNHHLRGAASDDDQAFVERVCGELRVPLELGQAHVAQIAQQRGDGLEAAAREARYSFLIETANRRSAGFVVTAHTADDQAETILHRVVRGTGLAGLAGIPPRRELRQELTLVRPLLAVRRTLILDYLETLGQTYREDESNVDRRFTRNRLRHELLENLREHYNPQVTEALLRLGTLAGEAQEVIAQLVGELMPQCTLADSPDHVAIDRTLLGERPRYLVRELLIAVWRRQHWPEQAMGFVEWDLLADMLLAEDAAPRQRMLPGCVTARRVGARLELSRAPARRQ
ncbi:MAG: tRNA lysidine(34) synthetase TilS [Pirellulales bacterium]|nr:tRNA lysidine(34) synthetase TilS [Pirellulales bacterium]